MSVETCVQPGPATAGEGQLLGVHHDGNTSSCQRGDAAGMVPVEVTDHRKRQVPGHQPERRQGGSHRIAWEPPGAASLFRPRIQVPPIGPVRRRTSPVDLFDDIRVMVGPAHPRVVQHPACPGLHQHAQQRLPVAVVRIAPKQRQGLGHPLGPVLHDKQPLR